MGGTRTWSRLFFSLLELGTKCLYLADFWFCLTFTSVEVLTHSTNRASSVATRPLDCMSTFNLDHLLWYNKCYLSVILVKSCVDLRAVVGWSKAALSHPSSAAQGRENAMKDSWVKIRTGTRRPWLSHVSLLPPLPPFLNLGITTLDVTEGERAREKLDFSNFMYTTGTAAYLPNSLTSFLQGSGTVVLKLVSRYFTQI